MLVIALLIGCVDFAAVQHADEWEAVSRESAVCFSMYSQRGPADVVAIGMDSGTVTTVLKRPAGLEGRNQVNGLARIDSQLFLCGGKQGLQRIDLLTGEVEASLAKCESVTDIGGGLMMMGRPGVGTLTWFASWDAVLADDGVAVNADHWGSRVGRQGGDIITAWHSTHNLERFDAETGVSLGDIRLQGYDTWVWGVSGAGERLFVLNDGRDPGGDWNPRIAEFSPSGDAVFDLYMGEYANINGLACSGAVDHENFVDDDHTEGTGPVIEF